MVPRSGARPGAHRFERRRGLMELAGVAAIPHPAANSFARFDNSSLRWLAHGIGMYWQCVGTAHFLRKESFSKSPTRHET